MEKEERECSFKPNVNRISHEIVIVTLIINSIKIVIREKIAMNFQKMF